MNRILKIMGIFIALTLISGTAYAADQTGDNSSVDWSGFDIGIFAAHSWMKLKYNEPDYPGLERDPNFDGFSGGVLLGYNYQIDPIVLGIEADVGWCDLDEGTSKTTFNYYSAFDVKWNTHFRTRVGYAFDSALFYVAGGLAIAKVEVDDTDPGWGRDDDTHFGWTIGCGIEYQIIKNLTARLEYLYDDYGKEHYKIDGPFEYKADVDLISHTVRIGLSYYF